MPVHVVSPNAVIAAAIQAAHADESSTADPMGHPQAVLCKPYDSKSKPKDETSTSQTLTKSKKKPLGLEPITEVKAVRESNEFLSVRCRLGLTIEESVANNTEVSVCLFLISIG